MELFPPLTIFYKTIKDDDRINTTHISLYMAMLHLWNINGGVNPLVIDRAVIMKTAKINASQTYNKSMNELHEYGYIVYEPTSNQFIQSGVTLKFV